MRRPGGRHEQAVSDRGHAGSALDGLVREGDSVVLLGLEGFGDDAWAVLAASGLRLRRAAKTADAVRWSPPATRRS